MNYIILFLFLSRKSEISRYEKLKALIAESLLRID